jgi:hypothetical protein
MGFEQGIGYVPYAGIRWDAVRTIMKDRSDGSPVKAAAATNLVSDPDSRTAAALVNATHNPQLGRSCGCVGSDRGAR